MRIQIRQLLTACGGLLNLLIIVFQPLPADASGLIYTVQAGSFQDIERAERQYHSVIDRLNKDTLDNLRIEKIGQYYSIRIGRFTDAASAEDLYEAVKHLFSSALLMKAYIKDERIMKLYSHPDLTDKEKQNNITSARETALIPGPLISHEKKEAQDRLFYTIQTGSFSSLERAQNEFASAMQKLFNTELDHIRIEKVGGYYSVRIGKFTKYMSAGKNLSSVKTHFVSALIMKAYIRDERIVSQFRKDPARQENRDRIQAKSINPISPAGSSLIPGSAGKDGPEHYSMLPVSDKLSLHGTVVMNNVKLAVIEDNDSKQSGLYTLNDQVGGFTVSDIFENTVILNKNNTMFKILLWEDNKIALSDPGPDLSQEITGTKNQSTGRAVRPVRGERGIKERLLRRKRQLAQRQLQSPVLDENQK